MKINHNLPKSRKGWFVKGPKESFEGGGYIHYLMYDVIH